MRAAPPHHSSIARALGPIAATMRAAMAAHAPAQGPTRAIVAVSGGADSMATLGLLMLLRRRLALELVVAHVDHGLRGGAVAEAELVVATARARGVAAWRRRIAIAPGPGLPARARTARREALLAAADEMDASMVVLGHTMTDQTETVLLNLCRGAGLRGIGGMQPWQPWMKPADAACRRAARGVWVRPMLAMTRDETRAVATRLGLPFVDDPGNDDETQPRVRVRRRVLPELIAINAAALGHVAATATVAREAVAALDSGPPVGEVVDLRALGQPHRRAAILALCARAGVAADAVAARTLEQIVAAIAGDRPRRWDLSGAALRLEGGCIRLEPLTHPTPTAILAEPGRNA